MSGPWRLIVLLQSCAPSPWYPGGQEREGVRTWQESCVKQLEVPEMPPNRTLRVRSGWAPGSAPWKNPDPVAAWAPFGLRPQEVALGRLAAWDPEPRQTAGRNRCLWGGESQPEGSRCLKSGSPGSESQFLLGKGLLLPQFLIGKLSCRLGEFKNVKHSAQCLVHSKQLTHGNLVFVSVTLGVS